MSDNLNRSGATRVNIMREVDESLRRLQTDYIDLYQVHGWTGARCLRRQCEHLTMSCARGRSAISIGLSNYMSWQATAVMLQERMEGKFVTAQMYYSLVGRGLEYEFSVVRSGIPVISWSPLAGGFLSGMGEKPCSWGHTLR